MYDDKISVIVPVYNAEKYLHMCIESILLQTYENFELILIDDGSSDSSREICNEYAQKDNRIVFLYQTNAGVSAARNAGIKISKGKYLTFVDSDDFVDSDFLEILIDSIKRTDADCVFSGLKFFFEATDTYINYNASKTEVLSFDEMVLKYKEFKSSFLINSAYAKLYKRDIIVQKHISFVESVSILEDVMFVIDYIKCCSSVSVLAQGCYHYRQAITTSLMKKYNDNANYAFSLLFEKEAFLRELLPEDVLEDYYIEHLKLYWSFIVQIYSRSKLSSKQKANKVKEYITMDAIFELVNAVDGSAKLKFKQRFECWLIKHKIAWLLNLLLRIRYTCFGL